MIGLPSIKDIFDLSTFTFIPLTILAFFTEFDFDYNSMSFLEFSEILIKFFVGTFTLYMGVVYLRAMLDSSLDRRSSFHSPMLGTLLLAIGLICLFSDYIDNFDAPLGQISGLAIVAWGFMFLKRDDTTEA